jgi:hypothetical protein
VDAGIKKTTRFFHYAFFIDAFAEIGVMGLFLWGVV